MQKGNYGVQERTLAAGQSQQGAAGAYGTYETRNTGMTGAGRISR